MISTFFTLIPTMLAAAAVPGWMALMLMLQRRPSLRAAWWFLGAILASRLLQGLAVSWVTVSLDNVTDGTDATSAISGLIEIIIGLAMLGTAVRALSKSPDPDAPPSHWIERLRTIPPPFASLAGAFLVLVGTRQWIFAFGAVRTIQHDGQGMVENGLLFVVFTIGATSTLIAPLALQVFGGASARLWLERGNAWLGKHGQVLLAVVSTTLGLYFLVYGLRAIR